MKFVKSLISVMFVVITFMTSPFSVCVEAATFSEDSIPVKNVRVSNKKSEYQKGHDYLVLSKGLLKLAVVCGGLYVTNGKRKELCETFVTKMVNYKEEKGGYSAVKPGDQSGSNSEKFFATREKDINSYRTILSALSLFIVVEVSLLIGSIFCRQVF